MQWLSLTTGLYAAAVAIPLLLLMYFLKLKRNEQIVSSTLLWRRAIQDLQVNAPFQRLRRSHLLLLQILLLLLILLALAGPVLSLNRAPAQRYVILIDRSASMSATDVLSSRFDEAKKQAKVFVDSLRDKALLSLTDRADQAMVIAFDQQAKVMCQFTSDKHQLKTAIDAIESTDGTSNLSQPLAVARAFAQSPGEENNNRSAVSAAQLILFSDGRIADQQNITVSQDELIFHCIGREEKNIALTAMKARRSYENPSHVDVFASLTNYEQQPATVDVQLSLNSDILAVKSVAIPPAKLDAKTQAPQPGNVAVNFALDNIEQGILEVRQLQSDFLANDDAAFAILAPPKQVSLLLVTAGNPVLESALKACPLEKFESCSPEEFEQKDFTSIVDENPYGIIVLDHYVPQQLPRSRYLIFGPPPESLDVTLGDQLENQVIVDWRSKHPVLNYVNLINLFAARCRQMHWPRDAEILAEFNETPAMGLLRRHGSVFLLVGFDVLESNWPFEPGFILFCYNTIGFLAQTGQTDTTQLQPSQPLVIQGLQANAQLTINGPKVTDQAIAANPSGTLRFAATNQVGLYTITAEDKLVKAFAINLLDRDESQIAPVRELGFSGQKVIARKEALSRSNLPLWPYLVTLALVLVCLEWFVYNTKIRP